MYKSTLRPLKAFVVATVVVVPALALSQSGPNRAVQKVGERGAVGIRALAYELYAYGQQAKDAFAVLTAASLMAKTPATETKREKTTSGSAKKEDTGKTAPIAPPDVTAMLVTARTLAGKNETLLAMIKDLTMARPKAPLVGPQWSEDVVLAGNTNTYTVTFKGGEPAEIAVVVSGDASLLLHVIDENDKEVCSRDDKNNDDVVLYCNWRPKWTGPFHINIKNPGRDDAAYRVEAS